MAATTATRSTRRADGLHHPHHHPHVYQPIFNQSISQQSHPLLVAPGTRRPNVAMKRPLPPLERDSATFKRRKHFVVEIPSKPASHRLHNTSTSHSTRQSPETTVASSQSIARPPEIAPQRPHVAKANPMSRPNATGNAATHPPPPTPVITTSASDKATNPTKHKEKVANGLKHELDRLQPDVAVTKAQGRKLRSQEATRFKSDLSAYFPDYDEVIGNDPKEHREQQPSSSLGS